MIFATVTGIRIPCVLYELTGIECPGCGVTRMILSIARLDFVSAWYYNPFLFVTGPILVLYIILSEIKYVKMGSRRMDRWNIFLWAELISALIFGVLRNVSFLL